MTALAFAALSLLAAAPAADPHAGETACERCHSSEGWREVSFVHDRTGFPLRGRHRSADCRGCHASGFDRPLSHDCAACHRDPHRGTLGARCAGCHDEEGWTSRYDADAHRRSGFPLSGRHAFLPCEECHGDRAGRGFARSTRECYDCHAADYLRTATGAIDHAAAGFPTTCAECHQPWRWQGARVAAHERCFEIAAGPHAGVRCLDCHTSLRNVQFTGACHTGTADCARCHGAGGAGLHADVPGFRPSSRGCYDCHSGGMSSGLSRRKRRR